ncbi:hypothetical protein D9M71_113840 [compost metagenome]
MASRLVNGCACSTAWRREVRASGDSVNSSLMNWPWLRWPLTARSISAAGFMYSSRRSALSRITAVVRLSSNSRCRASLMVMALVLVAMTWKCKKQTKALKRRGKTGFSLAEAAFQSR